MIRNDSNYLLRCGSLLQQYVVDMYAKIKSERLFECITTWPNGNIAIIILRKSQAYAGIHSRCFDICTTLRPPTYLHNLYMQPEITGHTTPFLQG